MKLTELLSTTYPWGKIEEDGANYTASFETKDGSKIEVIFSELNLGGGNRAWDVEFSRDGDYRMTGGGDAIKILATFLDIVEAFTHKLPAKYLTFSANREDASRVKVYGRLAKKITSFGYVDITEKDPKPYGQNVERLSAFFDASPDDKHFLLIRKDLVS